MVSRMPSRKPARNACKGEPVTRVAVGSPWASTCGTRQAKSTARPESRPASWVRSMRNNGRGQIFTPPISAGALRGITRSVVFEIAAELGIKITETDITRHDVFVADECFLTGTAAEVIPVIKADGRVIGTGKAGSITGRIMARFRALVREGGTPIYS